MRRTIETGARRRPRWPWALAAVVAGGIAGAVTAYVSGRVEESDGSQALEPQQLQAVVDHPEDGAAPRA